MFDSGLSTASQTGAVSRVSIIRSTETLLRLLSGGWLCVWRRALERTTSRRPVCRTLATVQSRRSTGAHGGYSGVRRTAGGVRHRAGVHTRRADRCPAEQGSRSRLSRATGWGKEHTVRAHRRAGHLSKRHGDVEHGPDQRVPNGSSGCRRRSAVGGVAWLKTPVGSAGQTRQLPPH